MLKPQRYYIAWQKWIDPLTELKTQFKQYNRLQHLGSLDWEDDQSEYTEQFSPQIQAMPVVSTPMGFVPAPMQDLSAFDFWIGHTNFHITLPIWKIINTSIGVESLDLISPYRFRISIGKAFNASNVKVDIGTAIKKYLKAYDKAKNNLAEE